jgi:hypothetical protein
VVALPTKLRTAMISSSINTMSCGIDLRLYPLKALLMTCLHCLRYVMHFPNATGHQ